MTLIEKLKKSREKNVVIDGHTFTIARPTPMQALEWLGNVDVNTTKAWFDSNFALSSASWREAAWYAIAHFVVDWDLQEIDLIPGGTGASVAFDVELLHEWLLDNPAVLNQLALAVYEAWIVYLQQREDDEKKSQSGSTTEPSPSNSANPAA